MAGATTNAEGKWGVDAVLDGYTVESINISTTPIREQVADQKNIVRKEIRYDTRYDLRCTLRGATEPANTTLTIDSKTFLVDNVEKAGTYNGLQRWNVTGHCYANCTAETALS